MRKYLLKADIFAERFGLNIEGEEKFRTMGGAVWSLIYLLILLGIFIQQMRNYFDRTNPVTTLQGYTTQTYPKVDLKKHRQLPFFVGSSTETDYVQVSRLNYYVTLKANRFSWITSTLPGGGVDLYRIITNYPVKPCRELVGEELIPYSYIEDKVVKVIFTEYGMCIAVKDQLSIQGKGIDKFMEEFYFHVKPCALPNEQSCATQAEVEKFNFQLFRPTANFDSSNFNDPHYQIANADEVFYLSIKTKQIYNVQLIKNDVFDLIGLNPEWTLTNVFYETDSPLISLQNRNLDRIYCPPETNFGPDGSGCNSYFTFHLMSSGKVKVRKRAYPTLADTLGTIGGISGILSMVFALAYSQFNEKKRAKYILSQVYPIMTVEKKLTTQKVRRVFPLCCFKKRIPLDTVSESIRDSGIREKGLNEKEASKRIYESLDVINIIRDSCYIRVMADMLLQERHKGLGQVLDIKLWREDKATNRTDDKSVVAKSHNDEVKSESGESMSSLDQYNRDEVRKRKIPLKEKLQKVNEAYENLGLWRKAIEKKFNDPAANGSPRNSPFSRSQAPGGPLSLRSLIHAVDEFYYRKLFKMKKNTFDDRGGVVQTEHLEMIQFKIGDEDARVENTEHVGLKENPEVLFKKDFDCTPDNEYLDSQGNQVPLHPIPLLSSSKAGKDNNQ